MSTETAPDAGELVSGDDLTIKLVNDTPLACVRVKGNELCGNPAHVANAVLIDGRYIVRPQCYSCGAEVARAYGLIAPEQSNGHSTS